MPPQQEEVVVEEEEELEVEEHGEVSQRRGNDVGRVVR